MKLIVDTSVGALFLRPAVAEENSKMELLKQTIEEKSVQMLGIIRQELLSGITPLLTSSVLALY